MKISSRFIHEIIFVQKSFHNISRLVTVGIEDNLGESQQNLSHTLTNDFNIKIKYNVWMKAFESHLEYYMYMSLSLETHYWKLKAI